MNFEKDYYTVLGILPDAEDAVVIAAYRALASLYHPDRWRGDVAEATRRMAEINVAYGVLGDAGKRKAYDGSRRSQHGTFEQRDEETDAAFDSALRDNEDRWQIAVSVFPDLTDIRARLARTAHRLAFAFATVMLESRQFANRLAIADSMENTFLVRYFGTNDDVLRFARKLIGLGQKKAVLALNRYVDVLGSEFDAQRLISKIMDDFDLGGLGITVVNASGESIHDPNKLRRIGELKAFLMVNPIAFSEEREGAAMLGYQVIFLDKGFRDLSITYEVRNRATTDVVATLDSTEKLVNWVLSKISPVQ